MIKTLIVDEDVKFRRMVKRILSNDSTMAVIGAGNNGHEAITKARELMPDFVLMGARMPEMNGLTHVNKKSMKVGSPAPMGGVKVYQLKQKPETDDGSFVRRKFLKEQGIMDTILYDNGGRRSGIDRHQYLYTRHIPERRSGEERRRGNDRRLKQRASKG